MKAMIDALQPEMMEASDEKSFRAVVKTKIGPIALPMRMAGEIISQFNPLEFMTKIRGQGGLIWLDQKAKLYLNIACLKVLWVTFPLPPVHARLQF